MWTNFTILCINLSRRGFSPGLRLLTQLDSQARVQILPLTGEQNWANDDSFRRFQT